MGTYFQKQAATARLHKLAACARLVKRARVLQNLTKRAEADDSKESVLREFENWVISRGGHVPTRKEIKDWWRSRVGRTTTSAALGAGTGFAVAPKGKALPYSLLGAAGGALIGEGCEWARANSRPKIDREL